MYALQTDKVSRYFKVRTLPPPLSKHTNCFNIYSSLLLIFSCWHLLNNIRLVRLYDFTINRLVITILSLLTVATQHHRLLVCLY